MMSSIDGQSVSECVRVCQSVPEWSAAALIGPFIVYLLYALAIVRLFASFRVNLLPHSFPSFLFSHAPSPASVHLLVALLSIDWLFIWPFVVYLLR